MKARKLTNKQKRFVEEYLANGNNATKAAISAGYNKNSARQQGHQLLDKTLLKEAIEEGREKISKKLEIDTEFIANKLLYWIERAEDAPVKEGGATANRSIELLGKMIGAFVERREDNSKVEYTYKQEFDWNKLDRDERATVFKLLEKARI